MRLCAEKQTEFDRQVDNLLLKGYPELAGLEEDTFLRHTAPLREALAELPTTGEASRIAFVIVVSGQLIDRVGHMPLVDRRQALERFTPIEGMRLPAGSAHLATDVETGGDTLSVTPDEAIKTICRQSRSASDNR